MSRSIFVIFVRNVPSIGKKSKEIEKYVERGPEIQKVFKKTLNYSRFVKVGYKGPRDELLARGNFKGIQRV